MIDLLEMAFNVACCDDDLHKQFFVACASRRNDGAIVISTNGSTRTNRVSASHAEARALNKSDHGSVLYVARALRDKKTPALAKPCATCQAIIRNKRVQKVFFTVDEEHYGIWNVARDEWRMKRHAWNI